MSLLREIQEAVLDQNTELGPILLKLQFLADRLGSHQLEEWVKFESEGYPLGSDVPEYRAIEISYTGNFQNIAWQYTNQPIPKYLIEKHCGESWTNYRVRESIGAIERMQNKADSGGAFGIDASNLILRLQNNIYEGMSCTSVNATFSEIAMIEIINVVRARILELTMKLEKEVPSAGNVSIKKPLAVDEGTKETVEQVFNTTVYGSNQVVASTGANAQIIVNNNAGDIDGVLSELVRSGVPKEAATKFASILSQEEPIEGQPFGNKVSEWLGQTLPNVAKGAWGISISIATSLLEEVAKKYYGLE